MRTLTIWKHQNIGLGRPLCEETRAGNAPTFRQPTPSHLNAARISTVATAACTSNEAHENKYSRPSPAKCLPSDVFSPPPPTARPPPSRACTLLPPRTLFASRACVRTAPPRVKRPRSSRILSQVPTGTGNCAVKVSLRDADDRLSRILRRFPLP